MESFINCISVFLPEKKLTNEILNFEFPEWSVEKISNKTGIYKRSIAADDEFVSDLWGGRIRREEQYRNSYKKWIR